MNNISWKKGVACGGFFLLLLGLTFYILLKDQDPALLWTALGQAKLPWLGVGAACMVLFFCCEARNIQTGLAMFHAPAPYRSCLLYGITGFFFSSVTPSASGGQPMQLYSMCRDGHPPAPSALALLTEFFSFQLAAVTLAGFGLVLHWKQLMALETSAFLCFLVGAGCNLLVVLVLGGAVFSRRCLPRVWGWLMIPARRLFPRRVQGWEAWGRKQWQDLRQCTQCYATHKKQMAQMFLVSLLQLAAYHSVPFWVYLAFGLSGQSLPAVMGLQAVLFLSVSSLPLPGAVGLSEGGFLLLYRAMFPAALLPGAMMLSRAVSFYLFLLLAGLFLAGRFLRHSFFVSEATKTM